MPPKRAAAAAKPNANLIKIREMVALCRIRQGETDDPTDELQAPILYTKAKNGALRTWQIRIGRLGVDIEEAEIYIPAPGPCYYYTVAGQIKDAAGRPAPAHKPFAISVSKRTMVTAGKSVGRANATTPLTQAILDARSIYNDKLDDGYKLREEDLLDRNAPIDFATLCASTSRGQYPWRVSPAASEKYEKHEKKLPQQFEVQPKLDGTMAIGVRVPLLCSGTAPASAAAQAAASHVGTPSAVAAAASGARAEVLSQRDNTEPRTDFYSRGGVTCESQDHIVAALDKYLSAYPGIHVIGELWLPGHSLQEISGNARRLQHEDAVALHYYLFDLFDVSRPLLPRVERLQLLWDIFAAIHIHDPEAAYAAMRDPAQPGPLHIIPSWTVASRDAGTVLYNRFLADNLEGAMLRDPGARHEYDFDGEVRSMYILKRKPLQDAEWPVVGWFCGKGKESDLVSWTCAQADGDAGDTPLADRPTFNTSINLPDAPRRAIAAAFSADPKVFTDNFYGKLMVIKYGGQLNAANGFPQQPKALYFRDPKVQAELQKLFE